MEYLKTNLNTGVLLLAGARLLFSLQKNRKNRKITEICSLALAIFFITEKNGKNRIITEICSLTLAIFFITEINGKNRKEQKFARYAHLLASSVAIFIMLAGARLSSSLQKKTEKTEKNRNFCLRQANSTLTITLTLTWLAGTRFLILLYFIIPVHILLV